MTKHIMEIKINDYNEWNKQLGINIIKYKVLKTELGKEQLHLEII